LNKYLLIIFFLAFNLIATAQKKNFFENPSNYLINGTYQKYQSAMGSGTGFIIHISIPQKIMDKKFVIDSVFINNEPIAFTIKEHEGTLIELNVYFPSEKPVFNDGVENIKNEKIKSNISSINCFFYIKRKSKRYKLEVSGYELIDSLKKSTHEL
jgi:hypothetical protein